MIATTPRNAAGPHGAAAHEPLREAATRALHDSGYPVLRTVRCDVAADGALVLAGVVPSFYLLQIAQTLLMRVPGVRAVRNRMEVRRPAPESAGDGEV
jgi:osmotically-inducible protein OsmY